MLREARAPASLDAPEPPGLDDRVRPGHGASGIPSTPCTLPSCDASLMGPLAGWHRRIADLDAALHPIATTPLGPDQVAAQAAGAWYPLDEAGVRTQAEALLHEIVRAYGDGNDELRAAIRALFASHPSFSWAAALPFPPTTPERFRDHLILFSIHDQGQDTRDAILAIEALCAQAVAAGVETSAALREVAMMSSNADRYGWGTTRTLLLRSIA